ncbi:hypothetical protein DCCM_2625 [Desulfocucumis palustris]|uniref:Uncharacterized protein n=1 Tax=Desulfocucumis palustris TaxID=1898651 RepID=A0A2L2XCT2_9FIRM|nr:hypothetical protein DCCM_2625 [Desulfocucumis palustris]
MGKKSMMNYEKCIYLMLDSKYLKGFHELCKNPVNYEKTPVNHKKTRSGIAGRV